MLQKLIAVTTLCIGIISCQHQNNSSIGYDQLLMYATQQASLPQWTSKARRQSLGGVTPSPSMVRPLFGLPFSEAKEKVRIIDIRSTAEFELKNLQMTAPVKSPLVHIPFSPLWETQEIDLILSAKNIDNSCILLIVSANTNDAKKAVTLLNKKGFSQVLYYENNYN